LFYQAGAAIESTQETGVVTVLQAVLWCPTALRKLELGRSRKAVCEVQNAQETGVEAVEKGDRCVAQLTMLLQRIVDAWWWSTKVHLQPLNSDVSLLTSECSLESSEE
jgi:hypothetical protein